MKPDMSPEAISRRLRRVGELVEACRTLRIKPGSAYPVGSATPLGGNAGNGNLAGDPVSHDKVRFRRNDLVKTEEQNPAQQR